MNNANYSLKLSIGIFSCIILNADPVSGQWKYWALPVVLIIVVLFFYFRKKR